jgi:cutinase
LVGPAFFNAVAAVVGSTNIAVHGVDYDATNLAVVLEGSQVRAIAVAYLTSWVVSKWPGSQTVFVGVQVRTSIFQHNDSF